MFPAPVQPKGSRDKWESEGEEEEGEEAVVSDAEGGAAGQRCGSEPGGLTCAICLSTIGGEEVPLADLAMVKGCDHMYCGELQVLRRVAGGWGVGLTEFDGL
mgnify:CR=1 FL=1